MSDTQKRQERKENTYWKRGLLRPAGKVILYMVMMGVLSLILTPILSAESPWVRLPINAVIFGSVWLLLFADGGSKGQHEVAHAIALRRREQAGSTVTDPGEISKCYHPMRGIVPGLLGALPFFVLAVVVMLTAKPYVYTLQDLPSWVRAYGQRPGMEGALAYYAQNTSVAFAEYCRIPVRIAIMPISMAISGFGDAGFLAVDRWSPLFVLLLPAAYALGYLRGESLNDRLIKQNEQAKILHKKKIARKKKRERAQRERKGPERLV